MTASDTMTAGQPYRVGMIVPSSNSTMETEIPALLSRRQQVAPERFTFHSARMRMTTVSDEQLRAMDDASVECAVHLSDARCDVLAYACLVAIMARGGGYHEVAEERLATAAADNGGPAPVVSSYIEECGIEVSDAVGLEVDDNVAVGRLDPRQLPGIARKLARQDVDAVVLSACVQMPSLGVIARAEQERGLPVLSAATATARKLLLALGLEPTVPDAGSALSADSAAPAATR